MFNLFYRIKPTKSFTIVDTVQPLCVVQHLNGSIIQSLSLERI